MRGGLPYLIVRGALAFAFLYPPLNAWFDPSAWIGYFPDFMRFLPDPVLLYSFGAVEIFLAIWILSGRYIFWPSVIAAAMLLAIVAFNLPQFQIVFRDVSLAAVALALAAMNVPNRRVKLELPL